MNYSNSTTIQSLHLLGRFSPLGCKISARNGFTSRNPSPCPSQSYVFCTRISFLFVSVLDKPCQEGCVCHYFQRYHANVFTCAGPKLPDKVENLTTWIILNQGNIGRLCGKYNYFTEQSNVTYINMESSKITEICDNTLQDIISRSKVEWLNLANNSLTCISKTFQNSSDRLTKIWLGGNPIYCDCPMDWMIDWLTNFRTSHWKSNCSGLP